MYLKKLLFPAAGLTLLVAVGFAHAAEDAGTIKSINPKGDSMTLSDGKTFILAEGIEAESLKVGQQVKVTYAVSAGKVLAIKIVTVR